MMNNQPLQEQTVAAEIAAEAAEAQMNYASRVKAAIAELSAGQIFKLALLALGLLV